MFLLKLYLPLVCISTASTSVCLSRLAAAVASLIYVMAPTYHFRQAIQRSKYTCHESINATEAIEVFLNVLVKAKASLVKRSNMAKENYHSLILSYGQTGKQRPQP